MSPCLNFRRKNIPLGGGDEPRQPFGVADGVAGLIIVEVHMDMPAGGRPVADLRRPARQRGGASTSIGDESLSSVIEGVSFFDVAAGTSRDFRRLMNHNRHRPSVLSLRFLFGAIVA